MNHFGNRQKQAAVVLVIFIAGLIWMNFRQTESIDVQVEKVIRALVAGAEARDVGPFKKHLDESYRDDRGRTKAEVVGLMQVLFLRHQKVSLSVVSLSIGPGSHENQREVSLNLLMSESILPQEHGNFLLTVEKKGSNWRVTSAAIGEGYGIQQ